MNSKTINLVNTTYAQTGESTKTNGLGMREMQARAFGKRNAQKLLIKAPPASGKSRALMFIALDKLYNQGIKKVIIAVPEKSIGASFRNTELSKFGFFRDWIIEDKNNLCNEDNLSEKSKVKSFERFMQSEDKILLCTHATLRFAFQEVPTDKFNDCLLAIDEFHHSSTEDNILGELLSSILKNTNAHILAMTGSYFRGDNMAIISPVEEREFEKVTYTYYEQLNGYKYLKSLGIGYHFYTGNYLDRDALGAVLDLNKKTIIHIPNVNSKESTQKGKHEEVGHIYDIIGDFIEQDENRIDILKSREGKIIRVANLVEDDPKHRAVLSNYLSKVAQDNIDAVDIIIALNMAKEGFDWPFCEHALTIGYRNSLTEIVQIIGRCTRDSFNKTKAQFTNLIAQPNGSKDEIIVATNDILKAITASLLMEQVLAPEFKFVPPESEEAKKPGTISVRGLTKIDNSTESGRKIQKIIESDMQDIIAGLLQNDKLQKASAKNEDISYIHAIEHSSIKENYPDLTDKEVSIVREYAHANMVLKEGLKENNNLGNDKFIKIGNNFTSLEEIDINLIDSVNPFSRAFEVISKQFDEDVFRNIKIALDYTKISLTDEEATLLIPDYELFRKENGKIPSPNSRDRHEQKMYEFYVYMKKNRERILKGQNCEKQ